jgi:hypothetical protein
MSNFSVCSNCEDGDNLDGFSICSDCGRRGVELVKIDNQRNKITKLLNREFSDIDTALIWHEINELVSLEIDIEKECGE